MKYLTVSELLKMLQDFEWSKNEAFTLSLETDGSGSLDYLDTNKSIFTFNSI
jgi:hypothetical protein